MDRRMAVTRPSQSMATPRFWIPLFAVVVDNEEDDDLPPSHACINIIIYRSTVLLHNNNHNNKNKNNSVQEVLDINQQTTRLRKTNNIHIGAETEK